MRAPDSPAPRLHLPRFLLATTVAALLVVSAPFIGQIRTRIKTAFPGQFVTIIGIIIGVAVLAGIVAAMVRIRDRRALRYGAIAAALVLGIAYAASLGTGNPEVDAVERFHFVEYGLITLLFYRAWRPVNDGSVFVLPVLAGIVVGTLEEWVQWFIPARIGEMRDVFLNCAAIACGLLFSIGLDPPERLSLRLRRGSLRRIGIAFVFATFVFAVFFHAVHLGHVVSAGDSVTFRSRYGPDELKRIGANRAVAWRDQVVPVPPRLSREDQYMSEGLWHVQWRNRRWDAGDIASAWAENSILEEFYAPVLDTPSYVSPTGHRWPPGQRVDAEQRATSSSVPARYESAAHQYPIYTWPPLAFWGAVVALMAAVLATGNRMIWRSDGR
jgi:hypothetical protein